MLDAQKAAVTSPPAVEDQLLAAISILQGAVLASDSLLMPDSVGGPRYMPTPAIEHVIGMLDDLHTRLADS